MADGYVKILCSILDSSIWSEPDDVVRVWLTLLAMADKDGYVGASVGGISARTRTVGRERVTECLRMFESPDDDSRSQEFDGRRIQRVERGWLILNYKKIRDMHGEEARKASKRNWWHANRGKGQLDASESSLDDSSSSDAARQNPMDLDLINSSLSSGSDARALPSASTRPKDPMRLAMEAKPKLADELFVAWRDESGKTGAKLDGARQQLFLRLVADGVTVEEVRRATRGAKLDEFAVSKNLSANLILSTADQREKYIAMLTKTNVPSKPQPQRPPRPSPVYDWDEAKSQWVFNANRAKAYCAARDAPRKADRESANGGQPREPPTLPGATQAQQRDVGSLLKGIG